MVFHKRGTHVCKLNKSIYGLEQASRYWFAKFFTIMHVAGYLQSMMITLSFERLLLKVKDLLFMLTIP